LAVASVVAVLGVPAVELPIGEPAQAPPAMNTVVPGESVGTVVEPSLENSEPASTTGETGVIPVETEGLETPTSDPTVGGDIGAVSEVAGVPVTAETALTPDSTTVGTGSSEPATGSTAEPSTYGTPGTSSAEPFGAVSPAGEYSQGTGNWPGSDDGTSGPGQSDATPGKVESGQPTGGNDGGPATDGPPSSPPQHSQAAEPGTGGPENSARPDHAGGGRHKKM
jgi:hypothetical protein